MRQGSKDSRSVIRGGGGGGCDRTKLAGNEREHVGNQQKKALKVCNLGRKIRGQKIYSKG